MYLVCPGRIAWTFTPNRVPDFVSRICILDKYQVKRWVANKSVVGCTLCPQFRSIASFASRCIFSTVSLYTINWDDITSQCVSPFEEFLGARIPFLLFFWPIIPFIRSFCTTRKSPLQVLANTCTVCLQLAVLWQLLKFRFFVFAVLIAPYGIAFPLIEKPSHRPNLKGNDSALLISRTTTFFIPCPAFHEFLFPAVTQAFLETFIISAPRCNRL